MSRLFVIAIFLSCLSWIAGDAELVLFDREEQVELPLIALCPEPPPQTRDAAVTLADYLEKITGQRPDLVDETLTKPVTVSLRVDARVAKDVSLS